MRRTTSLVALLFATTGMAQPAAAQRPVPRPPRRERVLVIDSVTVIDVATRALAAAQRIVIRGDSIVAVQAMSAPLPDTIDERVNGGGTFAIPGLTDHHVHLTSGMESMLTRAARGGVTMVQAMAGDNRTAGEMARKVLARELVGPEIAYASVMAGPGFFIDPRFSGAGIGFANGSAPWAQAVTAQTDIVRAVALARGSGAEVLKLYAMMDSALVARITAEAHKQGMRVAAHGTVFPAGPLQMVQGKVDLLTHAPYLAWQGAAAVRDEDSWDRRAGPFATVPADGPQIGALLRAMKQARTYFEPTLFVFARRPEERDVNAWGALVTRLARDAQVPIIAGTDGLIESDSTALPNIHLEMQALVAAGLTAPEALAAATVTPAREMHRERTHGAIATGHVADVVLLDANPLLDITATTRIRLVVLRGRVLKR